MTIDPQVLNRLPAARLLHAPLCDFTTFRLGGPCPCLVTCRTPEELEGTVRLLAQERLAYLLIGGGSNLVVSDEGLDAVVVRYHSEVPQIRHGEGFLEVSASTKLDDLVAYAAENGLEGLNYASGIPGTVGGAVVGNAGAFGRQIGDAVVSVAALDSRGNKKVLSPSDMGFSYRHSLLKETDDIVATVTLEVRPGNRDDLQRERADILTLRRQKHPDLNMHPCAGSFFRNVEPTSSAGQRQAAGWFLEQAGVKDLRVGGAVLFEKHANIIVNTGSCRADDVYALSRQMAERVREKFGLTLVREVRFVGRLKTEEWDPRRLIW